MIRCWSRLAFLKNPGHFPWRNRIGRVEGAAMTRPAIERCIKVFIVALIATFVWTVTQVLGQIGLF